MCVFPSYDQIGIHLEPRSSDSPALIALPQFRRASSLGRINDLKLTRQEIDLLKLVQNTFIDIFRTYGVRRTFAPGAIVLQEKSDERLIMLLSKGAVESCVHEIYDVQHRYHPMGCNFNDNSHLCHCFQRRPNMTMRGCGSILGSSQFLAGYGTS